MSLSDYISIFDTRPIAQSHLFEAATATLRAIYTPYTRRYILHVRTHTRCRSLRNTNSVCTPRRAARHDTAGTPHQATPRHATPRRFAGSILRCPQGPLRLMLTLTLPPLPLAASIVMYARACTRHKIDYETLSRCCSIYLCRLARLMDETLLQSNVKNYIDLYSSSSKGLKDVCWECPFKSQTISPSRVIASAIVI